MPLAYDVTEELTIPADAFNKDDIAALLVTGGRYGGHWVLNALVMDNGRPRDLVAGSIQTERDERPSMAVDTAAVWVNAACVEAGWKLAHWESKNDSYGPEEAPFFAAAIFLVDRRSPDSSSSEES